MVFFVVGSVSAGFFIFSYIIGMSLGWQSASTVALWASMEVCTMAALPLLSGLAVQEADGALVYFMFQTLGSMLILGTSVLVIAGVSGFGFDVVPLMMCLGIFMKMGSFPSYYWISRCLSKLSWFGCFLVTAPQKVLPLWLLHNLSTYPIVVDWVEVGACLTSFMGVALSPGVKDFRVLFGYSSIIQNGFMMVLSTHSFSLVIFYLILYGMVSLGFCFTMWRFSIYFSSCILKMSKIGKAGMALLLSFYALSLAGFPPFSGFALKVLFLSSCFNFFPFGSSALIVFSMISFYFYYQIFVSVGMSTCTGLMNVSSAVSSEEYKLPVIVGFMINFSGLFFYSMAGIF